MTQKERVLKYIEDFGSISGLEAIKDIGVMHLPGVIRDLANEGVDIERTTESIKNRYGNKTHYKRYSLKRD